MKTTNSLSILLEEFACIEILSLNYNKIKTFKKFFKIRFKK